MAAKIKKGDRVQIMAGKDKGRQGEVSKVLPQDGRVMVAGLNMVKRHTKPSQANTGGILEKEAPMSISNVMVLDGNEKPTRVGFRVNKDGVKERFAKSTGDAL
ncbi:MAG: 50S ribosomal protein L24 [Alphaproteobacteria bacterium]